MPVWVSHVDLAMKRSSNLIVDMNQGTIGSMRELGITESYKLKRQVVLSASEAAEMILR